MLAKLGSLNLHVNPFLNTDFPKLQLRDNVMVSDEFRAEFNQWLLDTFGTESRVFIMQGGNVFMSPKQFGMIKSHQGE